MKVTFKKINTFEGREGEGYNCDLYVDNIKVGHILNAGDGGEYNYYDFSANTKSKKKYSENFLLEYAKSIKFKENDLSFPFIENEWNSIESFFYNYQVVKDLLKFWKKTFKTTTLDITEKYCLIHGACEDFRELSLISLKSKVEVNKEKVIKKLNNKKVKLFVFNSYDEIEEKNNYSE